MVSTPARASTSVKTSAPIRDRFTCASCPLGPEPSRHPGPAVDRGPRSRKNPPSRRCVPGEQFETSQGTGRGRVAPLAPKNRDGGEIHGMGRGGGPRPRRLDITAPIWPVQTGLGARSPPARAVSRLATVPLTVTLRAIGGHGVPSREPAGANVRRRQRPAAAPPPAGALDSPVAV